MRRRSLLATFGAGLASLAGCSESPSDGSTPATTPAGTSPADGGGVTADAFEVVSVETPDRVEIGAPYRFHVTVRNTSDRRGTLASPLSVRPEGGAWQPLDQRVEVEVPPGETATWDASKVHLGYLGTYEFRIDALDERWSVAVTPGVLSFGTLYRTPANLGINVVGGTFESQFPTGNDGSSEGTTTATPTPTATTTAPPTATPVSAPDGKTWLLVYVRMRNFSQSEQRIPAADTFSLRVGDQTYAPQSVGPAGERYHQRALAGRTILQDPLVFAVPDDTSAGDVAVHWAEEYAQGRVELSWRTDD
jgi:hypothetical protein